MGGIFSRCSTAQKPKVADPKAKVPETLPTSPTEADDSEDDAVFDRIESALNKKTHTRVFSDPPPGTHEFKPAQRRASLAVRHIGNE